MAVVCEVSRAGTNATEVLQGIHIQKINIENGIISLPSPKCNVSLDYKCVSGNKSWLSL